MSEKIKIAVGYPSPERIDHRFYQDFIHFLAQNMTEFVIFPINVVSSRIVLNRNSIVQEAKRIKADYILWIDADTRFPPSGLKRLIAHNKDVVCATTSRRVGEDRGPACWPLDVKAIVPFQKLVPMKFIGFPFMLTKMSVFDKIERPYFAEPPRKLIKVFEGKEYLSAEDMYYDVMPEDEYFCWQLRQAGIDIWCDMQLTMEIGHIGTTVYYVKNPLPEGKTEGDITFEPIVKPTDEQLHREADGIGE